MKNKSSLLAVSLLFTIFTSTVFSQTSLEEYNYVTKGYKVQIESGLDMKKGYEIQNVDKSSTSERNAELKVLHRVKESKKRNSCLYDCLYSFRITYRIHMHPSSCFR
jgi:hypothetical protein